MQAGFPHDKDFTELYMAYYPKLIRFAREFVICEEEAEDIVQDIFTRLWEKRDSLDLIINTNAYLFRLIKNKCLDRLKKQISAEKYTKSVQSSFEIELSLKLQSIDRLQDNCLAGQDAEKMITRAINELPDRCREIFILSRLEGLKYKEIAEHLGVSVNTIESQMSIALRKLRASLKGSLER